MNESEEKAKLDRRIRLLKSLLIPLLLFSIFGTYLALSYSYLLGSAPLPLSIYADPTYASLEIWYLYGLLILLTVYYVRLQVLLTRRQTIIVVGLFILLPPACYLYLVYRWLMRRQASLSDSSIGETTQTNGLSENMDELSLDRP